MNHNAQPETPANGCYRIADLTLDTGRRELTRAGKPIELGRLSYAFFLALASNAPNVVTHDELVRQIWGGRTTSPETVTQRAKLLRDALGDDADEPRYIGLVRGHGYRLISPVESWAPPEAAAVPAAVMASTALGSRARWRSAGSVGVALLFVLATATGLSFVRGQDSVTTGEVPKLSALPCENLSLNPETAEFATGLHSEIVTALGTLDGLRVTGRTSVNVYADPTTRPPVAKIAEDLDVQYILECTVRGMGDEFVVAVELIEPQAGLVEFSERYGVNLDDLGTVFAVQTNLAARIAQALEADYSPTERARIERIPTDSRDAYALYLKAQDLDNRHAIELLNEAIRLDEDFALAHAALALRLAYGFSNSPFGPAEPIERRAQLAPIVRQQAERALALDANAAQAYTALGIEAFVAWRWTEAEAYLARAIDLSPSATDCPWQLQVVLLAATGRHDEAMALAGRAREVDPGNPEAGYYAFELGYAGLYQAAAMELERMIDMSPTTAYYHQWLAYMQLAMGRPDAALRQVEVSEQLIGDDEPIAYLAQWAYLYSRAGRHEEAVRLFDRIEQAIGAGYTLGAGAWAMAYLAIGDQAQALHWLDIGGQRATNHELDESMLVLVALKLNVTNDPVLRQPEFVSALARVHGE